MNATGSTFTRDEVLRRVGLWMQALERSVDNQALQVACPTCWVVPGCPCSADEDRLLPRLRLHQARAQLAWKTDPLTLTLNFVGGLD